MGKPIPRPPPEFEKAKIGNALVVYLVPVADTDPIVWEARFPGLDVKTRIQGLPEVLESLASIIREGSARYLEAILKRKLADG